MKKVFSKEPQRADGILPAVPLAPACRRDADSTLAKRFAAAIFCIAMAGSVQASVTLSGRLTDDGVGVAGVRINYTWSAVGSGSGHVTSDANGYWSSSGWGPFTSVTFTPSQSGYSWSPTHITYNTGVVGNHGGMNFERISYSISGTIRQDNSPATGVTISLSGALGRTLTSDSSGNFSFTRLATGGYTITPTQIGYLFVPASRSANLAPSHTGENFTRVSAIVATLPASNVQYGDATLNGTVIGEGTLTNSVWFEYGTNGVFDSTTPVETLAPDTSLVSVSAPVHGLLPGVLYDFRLVAANANGTNYGSSVQFPMPYPAAWTAVALDGDDDFIQVGDNPALKMPTALTLEAWVDPAGRAAAGQIINKEGEYELWQNVDGTVFYAFDNSTPGWASVSTGVKLPPNEWTHIALTYDSNVASNQVEFYTNGVVAYTGQATGTIGDFNSSQNDFRIGMRQAGGSYWAGVIDEVRVWNMARSATEIQDNFERHLAGTEPGLVAYFPFNEETGTVANDLGANSLIGMLNNGATFVGSGARVKDPVVTTVPASPVLATRANLQALVNPATSDTVAYFEFGETIAYGSVTPGHDIGSGFSNVQVSSTITNLQPGTTYHYRAVAFNSTGTTIGEDQTFNTLVLGVGWPTSTKVTGGFATSPVHVVDAQGNAYVAGLFSGSATFKTTMVSSNDTPDAFVGKLGRGADWLWNNRVTADASGSVSIKAIGVDSARNVYVAGQFTGTATFGTNTLVAGADGDLFVAKLNSTGDSWLWARSAGGSLPDGANALAVTPAGAVFIAGHFAGSIDFGTNNLASSNGSQDAFIAKLDANGNWLWARGAGGAGDNDSALAMALNSSEDVYVAGRFEGTNADFGIAQLRAAGGANDTDLFVARLSTDGLWLLARRGGGDGVDSGTGLAIDAAGQVYLLGQFGGTADYNSTIGNLNEGTSSNLFVAKLNANANMLWYAQAGAGYANSIAVDGAGRVYIAGDFSISTKFGNPLAITLTSGGNSDVFLAQLDSASGAWNWARSIGSSGSETRGSVGVDGQGGVVLSGTYQNTVPIGYVLLSTANERDIFIARFDSNAVVEHNNYVIGQPIPVPIEAQDPNRSDGGAIAQPTIKILEKDQPDSDEFNSFVWSLAEHKLYPVRPVTAILKWPLTTDASNTVSVATAVGRSVWPEHPQIHVANTPVDLEPDVAGFPYRFLNLAYSTVNGASVEASTKQFSAPQPGWTVLQFLDTGGELPNPAINPSKFEVVKTVAWNDPAYLRDNQPATIGKAITDPSHNDPTGKNGFVYFENAFYDGAGENKAYDRATRSGPIIPVNKDTVATNDDLVVVWYRTNNVTGIAWPSLPVRYIAQWPAAPDELVLSSGTGSGFLDPLLYPDKRVYNQPDSTQPGFNPNEEHAAIYSDTLYALRNDLNAIVGVSEPYTLLKYRDPVTTQWTMKVFKVVSTNATSQFSFSGEAGQPLQLPAPLSLMSLCGDSNTWVSGPGFKDHTGNLYARAAGPNGDAATVVARYWYPLQPDFFYDLNRDGQPDVPVGTCIPWLDRRPGGISGIPVDVAYNITWPADVPTLQIGESLLGAKFGLPDIFHFARAQIVYDNGDPSGTNGPAGLTRLFDPLAARTVQLRPTGSTNFNTGPGYSVFFVDDPDSLFDNIATDNQLGALEFSDLPYFLRARLRYDPLKKNLTFTGLLDQSQQYGGADDPLLLLNVLSPRERDRISQLSGDTTFGALINALYDLTRNPNQLDLDGNGNPDQSLLVGLTTNETGQVVPETLGDGPKVLTAGTAQNSGYITVAENDDPGLGGLPVALHVIRVENGPFRGDIKVIQSDNVFDDKLTLRHSADFGGEPQKFDFEWYYQPVSDTTNAGDFPIVDTNGTISDLRGWTRYTPIPSGTAGVNDITLGDGGTSGLLVLSDNYFICRYRGYTVNGETNWSDWVGISDGSQAQLAEGWVKRVRDGLNPFETRSKNFHEDETATFASMIQQAGPRYEGDIAVNPSGENLNSIGLIQAYETVLHRAKRLSIEASPPVDYQPANDALLLAGGYVADLYMLLGNEAFADAADPTIGFRTDSTGYGTLAPSIFTFENQVDSPLEEELCLLRGRDDRSATVHAPPVYNRLFWNFTHDEGEVAYAQAYNITDQNHDGVINADDAAIMYPQGHGDAWGYYLSATKTYYSLLRNTNFVWVPRAEPILLAGVPVTVDYLDERKFAKAAAAKAQTGAQIVDLTYRYNYVDDPAGQYQGYKDTDPDRAWGVSGWAHRAGSGALFDWVTANAILPATDPDTNHVGIEKIDRTTVPEIDEIVSGYESVQAQVDKADQGLNPLGIAKNAVPFDIDPTQIDAGKTHFEQIYDRAISAMQNALTLFNHANDLSQALRSLQDSVNTFSRNADEQERDFKNRLIEIYGYPYSGDIGPGKTYPTGYDGPDIYHYMYVNTIELNGDTAPPSEEFTAFFKPKLGLDVTRPKGLIPSVSVDFEKMKASFGEPDFYFPDDAPGDPGDRLSNSVLQVSFPYSPSDYGFTAPASWGQRQAPGEIQQALSEFVQNQARFKQAQLNYDNLIQKIQDQVNLLQVRYDVQADRVDIENNVTLERIKLKTKIQAAKKIAEGLHSVAKKIGETGDVTREAMPKSVGTSSDVFSFARAASKALQFVASSALELGSKVADSAKENFEEDKKDLPFDTGLEIQMAGFPYEIQQQMNILQDLLRQEAPLRVEAFTQREILNQSLGRYQAAVAKGLRLLDERTAFRKNAAADTQVSRYQDMTFRIFRNDAIQKYRAQFDLAARYVFLAATAYDYETELLGGSTGSGREFMTDIIKQRSLGEMDNGVPVAGRHGLADPLARLGQNFNVLKGQLGFNNPQTETGRFSMRNELFRLRSSSDSAWRAELAKHIVPNLWDIPEFRRYCRPFAPESAGPQAGLVIRFPTTITFGLNYFGWPLGGGDNAYDPTLFATKVRSAGVWFQNYNGSGLSLTPRVYLIPVGADVMRSPAGNDLQTREWRVVDQKIPVPFPIGFSTLSDPTWIPMDNSLSGTFADIRRFSSFRAYHDSGVFDSSETISDSRLIGRSVWNTDWMLIIPGGTLLNDPNQGLETFIDSVGDIKIFFQTYSYSGD